MEQCLPVISKNETTIKCGYFHDDPAKNHTVSLADIVPDLLLQDIDPEFLLNAEDINYQEDDTSLLGKGGYGKVYRGKCKGKSVAIKRYLSRSEEAFTELRSEAKLLQQSHHPCLVCLVGVCVHPLMAIVLEEAPLKSLEFPILKKKIPVHRVTIFRIAAEVAAALRFLHSRGIIFRDLKAANVLLWTLDPDSLCHCKLADFGIATHLAPIGSRGLQGTKGFIAPEVLYIGKRRQRTVYDHRADIFSFGMFLYQIIARRHPYHNIPPHRIDVIVESGERPKLQDVYISRTGYHYLTQVMQACWEDNPKNRFDTDTIIKKVCQLPVQTVMCVAPISGKQSLRQAIAITPSNFAKAGHPSQLQSELWVCCDGNEGTEISMFNIHTMDKLARVFIKENRVQCMAVCGDHVWVGSRGGIEYGVIDIFSIGSRELVHNIRMRENLVSCITATDKAVYMGTLEGYCFSFCIDISGIRANKRPMYNYVSEHAIDSIICTQECVWVTHTRHIHFLNLDSLHLEGSIHREKEQDDFIGQLSFDPENNIIWSAHRGGDILSAWNAYNKCHMYDIDTGKHLKKISPDIKDPDLLITAMTPALDTVWVGMASGHIMVFHGQHLLSWFHPYEGYVRFLTCIPSAGPCEMEKAIIASGGKGFQPLVEGLDQKSADGDETSISTSQSGTVIMWEAYEAKTMRQVKLLEEIAPHYLDNHNTVCRTIHQGQFRDGTHIISTLDPSGESADANASYYNVVYTPDREVQLSQSFGDSFTMHNPSLRTDSLRNRNTNFFTEGGRSTATTSRSSTITGECDKDEKSASPTTTVEETFNVKPLDSEQTILVRCDKPVKLKILLSEIQVMVTQDNCRLEYYRDEKTYQLQTQEQLDEYVRLLKRPQLCVSVAESDYKGAV